MDPVCPHGREKSRERERDETRDHGNNVSDVMVMAETWELGEGC